MSFANYKAKGGGQLAFRLQIESAPYEPVSHRSLELTASDGRIRYSGLSSDGMTFAETPDLVKGRWASDGFRVTLPDVRKRWTELFTKNPTATTYLDDSAGDNEVTDVETTIPVKSTAGSRWSCSST